MRIFALRVVSLAALVGLYELNTLIGVAALVSGFALVVWSRTTRHLSETDGGLPLNQ